VHVKSIGRRLAAASLLVVVACTGASAAPWSRTLGTPGADGVRGMAVAPDGTTYVAVETANDPAIVSHLDATGGILWNVKLSGVPWLYRLALRAGGGCVVGSSSNGRLALVALNADGSIAWSRAYGDPSQDYLPYAFTATADGGFVVVGWHDVVRAPLWVFKVDAAGVVQWQVSHRLADVSLIPWNIFATADGGVAIAGRKAVNPSSTTFEAFVMRLDSGGQLRWGRLLTTSDPMDPNAIVELADGSIMIGGSMSPVAGDARPWIGKLLADGSDGWNRIGPAGWVGWIGDLAVGPGDRVFANVQLNRVAAPVRGGLLEADATGTVTWSREIAWAEQDGLLSATSDGLTAAQGTSSAGLGGYDVLITRSSLAGVPDPTCPAPDLPTTYGPVGVVGVDLGSSASAMAEPSGAFAVAATPAAPGMTQPCSCTPDENEDDDACGPRVPFLALTARHSLSFCDDDTDWLRIDACGGQPYTIETSNLGVGIDTVLDVVTEDCTTILASDDDSGGGGASRVDWVAPSDGSFYVRVRDRTWSGTAAPYDVSYASGACAPETWARSYGTSGPDYVSDVEPAADGSFLIAGQTPIPGNWRAWLSRIDPSGAVSWRWSYRMRGTAGLERALFLRSGQILVVGDVLAANGSWDALVALLDAGGGLIWARQIGDASSEHAVDALQRADGSVVVLIASDDGPSQEESWLVEMDPAAGTVTRARVTEGGLQRLASAADGGLLAVGYNARFAGVDGWAMRLDAAGALAWQVHEGSANIEGWFAAAELPDGGWMVGGLGREPNFSSHAIVSRLDRDGAVTWDRQYGTASGDDSVTGLVARADGSAIVTRSVDWLLPGPGQGARIMAVDGAGAPLWDRCYSDAAATAEAIDVAPRAGGGWLLASTRSDAGLDTEAWLLALDDMGRINGGCVHESTVASTVLTPSFSGGATDATLVASSLPMAPTGMVAEASPALMRSECAGFGAPLARPGEVSPPGAAVPLRNDELVGLSWEDGASSGSVTFNLYRGDVADLRSGDRGACFLADFSSPSAVDAARPGAGNAWFYLVTGRNAAGEGTMGHDSFGGERVNLTPCL
jgi:hypothetical protein